jgi:hypothetical protein
MTERLKLNALEAQTPLWFTIRSHYEGRLAALRSQNDSMALDPAKTAELRGRIAEIKGLLHLDRPDRLDTKPE